MTPNAYLQRVVENLGPLSREKLDPGEILKEWVASGESRDNGDASDNCGVCSHADCRYMFSIVNRHTDRRTESGSTCILRFAEIAFRDAGGAELYGAEKAEALQSALNALKADTTRKARLSIADRVKAAISNHATTDPIRTHLVAACDKIIACIEFDHKAEPEDIWAFALAVKMTRDAAPLSAFRGMVSIRTRAGKQFLVTRAVGRKNRWEYEMVKPALTDQQRNALERFHLAQKDV